PFLVGGNGGGTPFRIYHQSFRDFLLEDPKFTVFPSERHAAIARYLQDRYDMLPSIVRAAKEFLAFRRGFLRADSVVALAEQGRLEHAEARLELFSEVDADWQSAARLILAWLG